jgi:hypothetical protein
MHWNVMLNFCFKLRCSECCKTDALVLFLPNLWKQVATVPVVERGRTSSVGNYGTIPILKIFPTFLNLNLFIESVTTQRFNEITFVSSGNTFTTWFGLWSHHQVNTLKAFVKSLCCDGLNKEAYIVNRMHSLKKKIEFIVHDHVSYL